MRSSVLIHGWTVWPTTLRGYRSVSNLFWSSTQPTPYFSRPPCQNLSSTSTLPLPIAQPSLPLHASLQSERTKLWRLHQLSWGGKRNCELHNDQSVIVQLWHLNRPISSVQIPKTCWIIKVIDSPELFLWCFSDLQPIKGVLCLLYSFELCPLFRFKTPCKRNESVNGVSWEPRFNLRQGAMGETFMGSAFQASQLSQSMCDGFRWIEKTRLRFQILISLNYEKGCDPKDFHGF